MGFEHPDGRHWEVPVSDVQAYRQFGNAVVVPVVKHIAQHISPHLFRPDELGYEVLLAQLNLDGQLVYSHA